MGLGFFSLMAIFGILQTLNATGFVAGAICGGAIIYLLKRGDRQQTVTPSRPVPPKSTQLFSTQPFNRDLVKIKLEDLFFNKKLSKDVLEELLVLLGIKSPSETPQVQAPPKGLLETPISSVPERFPKVTSAPIQPTSRKTVNSGFFSADNIKTLLISGCTLFVLAAYLFVRSYWALIPSVIKFGALLFITLAIHVLGRMLMGKKETPKTAETLLTLAVLLVPFNFYAANVLLLGNSLQAFTAWSFGFLGMFIAAIYTAQFVSTVFMGFVMGAGLVGATFFGGLASDWNPQVQYLASALTSLLMLCGSLMTKIKEDLRNGILFAVNATSTLVFISLMGHQFFINTPDHFISAMVLIVIGVAFAIQSRVFEPLLAYGAGLCFMGAGAVLLHNYAVPTYKYGLYFVPASLVAVFRAWTFERGGRNSLAAPYFLLAQLGLLGSVLAIFPSFEFFAHDAFKTLVGILLMATFAYSLMGVLYRQSIYSYAGGIVVLLLALSFTWHYDFAFALMTVVMAGVASLFVLAGMVGGSKYEEQVGVPLSVLGVGCLSTCLALLGGKWAAPLIQTGSLSPTIPMDQINAGIWVGTMSVGAYALLALVKKQIPLVYPALVSASMVYLFWLQRLGLPIDLLNISWIVVGSLALFYISAIFKWKSISRCFSLWGELVFFVVLLGSFNSDSGRSALYLSTVAFLPAIFVGSADAVTCLLFGIYSSHFLWFKTNHGITINTDAFLYSIQLLLINCGVVLMRALVGNWQEKSSLLPYRVFIGFFSVVSLGIALSDRSTAWQIYLAYGVVSLIVSYAHYQGRFNYVGTTLLVIAYELFLWSTDVQLTEAYSVPAAVYVLICGTLNRNQKEKRDLLYGLGQMLLYLPSFNKAIHETWEFHGIFLGVASMIVMIYGMSQRNKCLTFGSVSFLILNGLVQSVQFLTAIPRWVYLGLGGITLVSLGGLFEFKRETLIRAKDQIANSFEGWE